MIKVYTASTPAEAYILKGILESNGIASEVQGDQLFNLVGELPFSEETAPTVWVLDDSTCSKALRVVENYRDNIDQQTNDPSRNWVCPSCGEVLEGQFTECWQCGESRLDA